MQYGVSRLLKPRVHPLDAYVFAIMTSESDRKEARRSRILIAIFIRIPVPALPARNNKRGLLFNFDASSRLARRN